MKIAELIKIPLFSGMNLIAGENGKNHEVDTINMMDAPDIVHFLKPNELLVTTAYHLKDQPHLLKDLVRSMAAAGCAGLGVKTKRFLQEIPGDTILLANELEFPIIELPLELSLGAIVHEILRAILDQRAGEIRYALEIHKQFTNLILDGKGIHTLLVKLSEMIGYPIVLLDRFLKIKKPDLPNQNSSTLVKQLLENNVPFPTGYSSFITFSLCKTKKTYSIFSINISKENFGFLVILGQIEQRDQLSILTIEQAANVIAFSFMQEIAVKQSQRRIRNEFFLNFTNGAFSSQEEVINRAKEFSLNNEQPYICAVGTFDGGETKNHFSHYQKMDLLFEFLEEEAFEAPFPVHLFTQGSLCILLFGANGVTGENTSMVEAALKQMQAKIIYHFHKTASFGLSTICQNFLDVKNAFTEAVHAFHEGQLAKKATLSIRTKPKT